MPLAIRTLSHQDGDHRWEMASRDPDPRLAAFMSGYQGYAELAATPMRRMELPFAGLPMIVSLGPRIGVKLLDEAAGWTQHRSFIAGLHDRPALTEYTGAQEGVQVNFTPIGACLILGRPLAELFNEVVALEDLFGDAESGRLVARLQEAPGWAARFQIVDGFLLDRLAAAPALPPELAWAWQALEQSGGQCEVAGLAGEIGWSRKHLSVQFRQRFGLPPKTVARILRFHRTAALLGEAANDGRADIALAGGYYDQPHFNRDFRQFAGCTPGDYLARLLPDGGGVAATEPR